MTHKRHYTSKLLRQLCIGTVSLLPYNMVQAENAVYKTNNDSAEISLPLADNADYTFESKDHELYLSFSEPLSAPVNDLKERLPALISSAQLSEDRKSIVFSVKEPVSVQNFRNKGMLTIRINEQNPVLTQKNIEQHSNKLLLNYGKHPDFSRFTFDYSPHDKPEYTVKTGPLTTTVSFRKKYAVQAENLVNYPNAAYILQQITPQGGLDIIFPAPMLNTFEHRNKLVFDLKTPQLIEEAEETLPPAETSPVAVHTRNMTGIQNSMALAQVSSDQPGRIASLSFSWNMPVGLSVFQRGDYIWIIFDHAQNTDINSLQKTAAQVADEVIQLPHPSATVLRLHPKVKLNASVRKEGLLWIVDLFTREPPEEIKDLPVYTQYNINNEPYLFIPSTAAGEVVSVIDPEIGDLIVTGTSTELGLGIQNAYTYPDFTLLQTTQGIAFNADATDVALNRGNTGYTIQAVRRGLNISPDLERLKHQKQLDLIDNKIADLASDFDQELLGKNFAEAEKQLQQDIILADDEHKNNARLELAKYYLSQGLGTNALSILNKLEKEQAAEIKTERFQGMMGVARFLAKRYKAAIESLSYGRLPEINEAVFWRTLAASALSPSPDNNAVLVSYLNKIRNYPPQIRRAIAETGARTAIAAGDDITAQSFIDILKTMNNNQRLSPQINYLTAEKMLMQGYPRNAVQEYRKAAKSSDMKYSALARKKIAELEIRLNVITPDKAAKELEGLRFAWGEINFKRELLSTLSNLYVKNHDYYSALRRLQELKHISEPEKQSLIEKRMVKLFEDIYINNQADNLNALKSLALYHDYSWLAPKSENYNTIIQKLADRLVAVDLLDRAFELLNTQMNTEKLTPQEQAAYGSRMALIQLFNGNNQEALKLLERTEAPNLPETLALQRRIIKAKALSGTGNEMQALDLLKDDYSKNALLLKSEIFWNGNMWGEAANAIKYLIEKPQPGKPLSEEQINYILDWATALKKAGHETVIVRLRNKFMPWFKNTKYYSAFSVLTDTLENSQINIRVIDKAINDVETFSNFAKIYNQSLIDSSLTEKPNLQNNAQ